MKKHLVVKKHLAIFIALVLTSCVSKGDYESFGFKDDVKSCLERTYEVERKFGKWENGDIEYYGHTKFSFDKNGNYLEIEELDDDGRLRWKIIPTREKGKIIKESNYDDEGKLVSETKISLFSSKEIESEIFDNENSLIGKVKTYRERGKNIKRTYTQFEENELKNEYTTTWKYDNDGNIIEIKLINKKGEIQLFEKYEYLEFDKHNNWIRKLSYEDKEEPKNIVIREIEYY
jgi:hypothetical protein